MNYKKKKMAAVSAVMNYIKTEEEAVCAQAMAATAAAQAPSVSTPAVPLKLWGISGRQALMQMRGMMQLRTFQGSRFR